MLGRIRDVSYEGLAVLLRSPIEVTSEDAAAIHIALTQGEEKIVLRAQPVHVQPRANSSRVGFKIILVERGEQKWHHLCYVPSW